MFAQRPRAPAAGGGRHWATLVARPTDTLPPRAASQAASRPLPHCNLQGGESQAVVVACTVAQHHQSAGNAVAAQQLASRKQAGQQRQGPPDGRPRRQQVGRPCLFNYCILCCPGVQPTDYGRNVASKPSIIWALMPFISCLQSAVEQAALAPHCMCFTYAGCTAACP